MLYYHAHFTRVLVTSRELVQSGIHGWLNTCCMGWTKSPARNLPSTIGRFLQIWSLGSIVKSGFPLYIIPDTAWNSPWTQKTVRRKDDRIILTVLTIAPYELRTWLIST